MRVGMSRLDAPEPSGRAAIIFVENKQQNNQKVQSTGILIRVKTAPSGSLPAAGRPPRGRENRQSVQFVPACLIAR